MHNFGDKFAIGEEAALAVLPLGAMESHGPHLPLDTDSFLADALLHRAADLLGKTEAVLRLPCLWLAASGEHAHANGTLTREPEALITDILAVGAGLARSGIRKILLFNAHGGNIPAAQIAVLKLRRQCGMLAADAHWLDFGMPPDFEPPTPVEADVHGGWLETSLMMHLAPNRVGQQSAPACEATTPAGMLYPAGPINWGWRTDDLMGDQFKGVGKANYVGRPDLASAEIGALLAEHAARGLADLMRQLAEAPWSPDQTR